MRASYLFRLLVAFTIVAVVGHVEAGVFEDNSANCQGSLIRVCADCDAWKGRSNSGGDFFFGVFLPRPSVIAVIGHVKSWAVEHDCRWGEHPPQAMMASWAFLRGWIVEVLKVVKVDAANEAFIFVDGH